MQYIFLKPQTGNIWLATWNVVKLKWQFWVPLLFVFIIGPIAVAIAIIYFIIIQNKVRSSFWKEFADLNGWQYKNMVPPGPFDQFIDNSNQESGLMFKEGSSRIISNEVTGVLQERPFRIFCYQFSVGTGKSRRIFYYTVFTFKFNGSFPHIYLNNKSNSWNINTEENIPLPQEFKDKFSISTPKKYEIEALEIFTPDIFATLLDKNFSYDVEFINQEILIFTDGQINNFEQLEKRFYNALELKDLLSNKLDKFKFEKIGNLTSTLI